MLQVEEERLDHVLGDLAGDQLGEVAALDPAGGVEVHLGALDRGVENRPRCRHRRTLELFLQQRRERREDRRQLGAARCAARHLVPLGIPRLGVRIGVGLDPRLRGGHQFVDAGDDLVDEADLLGLRRLEPGALRQHVHERVLDAEHPHGAGHATGTRQQAERHLREADDQSLDVGGDAVVTRQRDLQAAAQGGAVDRRDHRLAEGLQRAQLPLDRLDEIEGLTGILGPDLHHALDVAACEERVLCAGDDDTGDRILLGDKAFDGLAHRLDVGLVHHVCRPGRVVQRQRDDAVVVLVPLNGVLCHDFSLRLAR